MRQRKGKVAVQMRYQVRVFPMIEPNSPIGNLSVRGKDTEALVDERPKCFTGGRSSIGAAQCAGSELGETPVMEALSYMTE